MPIELSRDERDLLVGLLEREFEEVRTEVRHTQSHDYKESLKARERCIHDLLERLKA